MILNSLIDLKSGEETPVSRWTYIAQCRETFEVLLSEVRTSTWRQDVVVEELLNLFDQ